MNLFFCLNYGTILLIQLDYSLSDFYAMLVDSAYALITYTVNLKLII